MPIDYKKYPADWHERSKRVRERAGNRCECEGECRLHRGRRCVELNGNPAQWANGKIILTVAHLDHTEMDCADEKLKAMCQRCHLRYDRDLHALNSANTRRLKSLERQPLLPGLSA